MLTAVERLKGSITALITPFKNGAVDEPAFTRLVEWQIAEGTHGLVPVGTTGESPTLSHKEHMRVVELCVTTARGRVPVIAGAGSNSTREAIELTRHAKAGGGRCRPLRRPILQQADPGRALPPLRRDRGGRRPASSSFTISPAGASSRSRWRCWRSSRRSRTSWALRTPPETWPARAATVPRSPVTSSVCRGTTRRRSASWRMAGAAAFR